MPKAKTEQPSDRPRFGWALWLLVGVTAAAGAFLFARDQARGGGEAVDPPERGLPHTPDYHALFVFPDDPAHLLLGTHVGVYESTDGGVRWRFLGLEGQDAMHFAHEEDGTIWVAGHNVLARSEDGARTWSEVHPEGLPSRDVHGFAIASETQAIFAAVAGEGLYRSDDGGTTFSEVPTDAGANVYALAVTHDGVLFAADSRRGVLMNASGDGVSWAEGLAMPAAGLAANEGEPPDQRVLAAGESVQLFTDAGGWSEVFRVEEGTGPVAFAESPLVAYLVGFDRKLYRSDDGGETWKPVA